MDAEHLTAYVERIYGFAVKRTFSRDEADDLTQEILLAALRSLGTLKAEDRFEPWLFALAGNVTRAFRRRRGRERAMCSYDEAAPLAAAAMEPDELPDRLRRAVAMLSESFRSIVILHYYDGLSVREIAQRLALPEGTVTWRLSAARARIRKECEQMNESALRPVRLEIRINGEGSYRPPLTPFPHEYVSDALSQNILHACYAAPRSVEELAAECGVPAYYVEERLDNLLRREAVSLTPKGRFRTEFLIYTDEVNAYVERTAHLFVPLAEDFAGALRQLAQETLALGVDTAGKPQHELTLLFGMMAVERLSERDNPVPWVDHPVRYDGGRWSYHAHLMTENRYPVRGLGREQSALLDPSVRYAHTAYHFGGFAYRRMMTTEEIAVCAEVMQGSGREERETAASMLAEGFLVRRADGTPALTTPVFTRAQYAAFRQLAEACMAPVAQRYAEAVAVFARGYRRLFPAHLAEAANRACHYMYLTLYAVQMCDLLRERGLIEAPGQGSCCDVLIGK